MFTFQTNSGYLTDDPILVTGIQRSGTSLTGSLIGSLQQVEYDYEPWLWGNLPIMAQGPNAMDRETLVTLLGGFTNELFSNHVLARNINMRKTDMSCKTFFKSHEDIDFRWNNLHSRQDVREWVLKENIKMSFKLVNAEPFIPLFWEVFPKGKVIHVIRDPFDAALSAAKKGWMDLEEFSSVESADVRRKANNNADYFFPWWLKSTDEDLFLSYSEFERALYAWVVLMAEFDVSLMTNPRYFYIAYEDLLQNSKEVVSRAAEFIGKPETPLTHQLLAGIKHDNAKKYTEEFLDQFDSKLVAKARRFYQSIVDKTNE